MSLLSRAQTETNLCFVSNLDTSATERINGTVSGTAVTGSGTAYGTITQNNNSLTGTKSYDFGSDGYVIHTHSPSGGGIGNVTLEIVFKKSSAPASGIARLIRYNGISIYNDGFGIYINTSGQIVSAAANSSGSSSSITTTTNYCDNKWHHVLAFYSSNNNYHRLYVDGNLINYTPQMIGNIGRGSNVTIGASLSQTATPTVSSYFNGTIDFAAVYETAPSLANVGTFVSNHLGEFANKLISPDVMTTSALFVQPALSTTKVLAVSPMTANATLPNPLFNETDFPTTLESKMLSLTTNDLFLFKEKTSYSIGNNLLVELYNSEQYYGNGPSGAGTIRVGSFVDNGNARIGTVDTMADGDMTLGIWFKLDPNAPTDGKKKYILSTTPRLANSGRAIIDIYHTDGKISYRFKTSNADTIHSETTDLRDGKWHFAALRCDLSTIKYYLDGSEVHSSSFSGARSAILAFWLGTFAQLDENSYADSTNIYLSGFFIANSSDINGTQISQIYNAGNVNAQAGGMIPVPVLKFNNAFDYLVEDYNPPVDFRFNEYYGTTLQNFGFAPGTLFGEEGTILKHIQTKNRFGYNYNEVTSYDDFGFDDLSINDDAATYVLYANMATPPSGENHIYLSTGGDFDTTTGMAFGADEDGPWISWTDGSFDPTGWDYVRSADANYLDGWHLYVAVKDGSDVLFYIDGKLIDQTTTAIANPTVADIIIGGVENYLYGDTSTTDTDRQIDEFKIMNLALSPQEIFELWQSIQIDGPDTSSANLVMPTFATGYGPTISASPMTVDAFMLHPQKFGPAMLAFATILHPNYYAEVIIDSDYGVYPLEANAEFHMPQYSIGEFNSADHMDASAVFVNAEVFILGRVTPNPMIAQDAKLIMPGIVTVKGARVFAETLTVNAIFPLPPAYVQLTDDDWYVKLLQGHAERVIEPVQAILSNLPNQSTTDVVKGGFLSFFEDLANDRTASTTTNYITNEIPAYYYKRANEYSYDSNGNVLPLDTSKSIARLSNARASLSPAPILGSGTYDPYQRKAARVNNVEIPLPGTDIYFSTRPYNIEFSFKATKQNQVIAYGTWNSWYGYQRTIGVIGLSDGKIYLAQDNYQVFSTDPSLGLPQIKANVPSTAPHPKNTSTYLLGRTNVADGQWHHIIIQQGWTDGRTQIWVDGQLDRQIGVVGELGGGYSTFAGSNGTNKIRPYIIGFNSSDSLLYSDFETSAWNFYPARFITQDKILANFAAYSKWKPVKAEPMTATIRMTDNNAGKGNRARALLLYWWPYQQFVSLQDRGKFGYWDESTFPLETIDPKEKGPQQYYGWDIFPIDVVGRTSSISDMIKPGVWQDGGYRDIITGSPRYLDLMNDIDISKFDAIFFKNYPEQTPELDEYVREELADTYFNIKEKTLHENFLKSLRAAVDTGISLFVTNAQLALDLGIVDRVERISDMDEGEFEPTDEFVTTKLNVNDIDSSGTYYDTWRNNRLRVVNTFEDITNYPTYLWSDWMYFRNDDELDYGGADRPYTSFIDRPNGLQVGDEFIISDAHMYGTQYEAVPFENVKAGTIITAFSNQVLRGNTFVENPYKNHATCIAVPVGTILQGKATGGKIFVNFTERINRTVGLDGSGTGVRPHWFARDTHKVELIQDKWINLAYSEGIITLAKKNELLTSTENLDRQLEAAIQSGNQVAINTILARKHWDYNGINIITNKALVNDPTGVGVEKDGLGDGVRKAIVNKVNRKGIISTRSVSTTAQWFTIAYADANPTTIIKVPSLLSNGFSWLADKVVDDGTVIRVAPMVATNAQVKQPIITGDKPALVYVQTMLSNARLVPAPGYAQSASNIAPLPMFANARFAEYTTNIMPSSFVANATFRQNVRTVGIQEDEVVVYMVHVDPILYLREDVIK